MPRLSVRDIVMQFPAVRALDGVSLEFEQGEVHGIIGENGAGKSTLMRILAGLQQPTEGQILVAIDRLKLKAPHTISGEFAGRRFRHNYVESFEARPGTELDPEPVSMRSVGDALSLGIAMIHQELNLVDQLNVAENVHLGREPRRTGILDRTAMHEATEKYLKEVGATFGAETPVGDLSIAGKQLVEIAKALSYEASILIMDEPTAVLSEKESLNLFDLIQRLKSKGVTVIYISHRLAEVEEVCDRITVLRDGNLVKTVVRGEVSQSEMASLMVGRPLGDMFPEKPEMPPKGVKLVGPAGVMLDPLSQADQLAYAEAPPALTALNLSDGERVFGVSLEVWPGEILGLAGLVGAGRTEVAELLFGVRRLRSGTRSTNSHMFPDADHYLWSPKRAARQGIVYVSEDRKDIGLILSLDVVKNLTLANLGAYAKPLMRQDREERATKDWIEKLDIRAGDIRAPIMFLSGGNQQKVSIAKWLDLKPKVLIIDEPTRGVDVGAKRELYLLIKKLADEGLACIVISSEMQELIGLCHRILVMRNGRIVGELEGGAMTEEAIMHLAAGVEAA